MTWGPAELTKTAGTGWFWCPTCLTMTECQHQVVMRWFHVNGNPVFPIKNLGEYIECGICNNTFDLDVVADPGAAGQANFQRAIRHLMAKMILADGHVDERERRAIQTIHLMVTGARLETAQLNDELAQAEADPRSIADYCDAVVGQVNDAGKQQIIRSAYMIALADGEYHDAERALLGEIAAALNIPDETLDRITGDLMMFEDLSRDELVEAPVDLPPAEIPPESPPADS